MNIRISARQSGYWITCLLALVASAGLSGYRSAEPAWDGGFHAFVQSEYPQNALNYLRHGYLATRFAPVMNNGDSTSQEFIYRFSHGPVTALLISLSYALLGVSDLSARLVPLTAALGSVLMTFLIALHVSRSRATALLALIFCGLMPMQTFYARMPGPHLVTVFFLMLALYAYQRWAEAGQRRWLAAFLAVFAIGLWTDWIAYFLAPPLALAHLLTGKRATRWRFVLLFGGLTTLLCALYFAWAQWVGADLASEILGSKLTQRTASGADSTDLPFGAFLALSLQRMGYWLTLPVTMLVALWAVLLARAAWRRSLSKLQILTATLLGAGLLHNLVFRNRVVTHEFIMLFHLVPACALAAADALAWVITPRPRWPRAIGALAASALLAAFLWQSGTVFSFAHAENQPWDRARYNVGYALRGLVAPDRGIISTIAVTWPVIDTASDRPIYYLDTLPAVQDALARHPMDGVLIENSSALDRELVAYLIATYPRTELYGYSFFQIPDNEAPIALSQPSNQLSAIFGGQIELLGYDLSWAEPRRADPITGLERYLIGRPELLSERTRTLEITTYWRRIADDAAPINIEVRLASISGAPALITSPYPGLDTLYPTSEWPLGQTIRLVTNLQIGAESGAGRYQVTAQASIGDQMLAVSGAGITRSVSHAVVLDAFDYLPQGWSEQPLRQGVQVQQPTNLAVAEYVRLAGYSARFEGVTKQIDTAWSAGARPSQDYQLFVRLQSDDIRIDRAIALPPPRMWGGDEYLVATRIPSTLPPRDYRLSIVSVAPDGTESEHPFGSLSWCGDLMRPVFAERISERDTYRDLGLYPGSPMRLDYSIDQPQDVELQLEWSGASDYASTLVNIFVGRDDATQQHLQTLLITSDRPGVATITIPQSQTHAGANALTLQVSDQVLNPGVDAQLWLLQYQEKRTHHSGWIDLDHVQIRAAAAPDPSESSTKLTPSSALLLLLAQDRASGCLTPEVQASTSLLLAAQLKHIDWSSLPTTDLLSMAATTNADVIAPIEAALLSRMDQRIDTDLYRDGVPIMRVIGRLDVPGDSKRAAQVVLLYEALQPIEIEYTIFMHAYPPDLSLLTPDRQVYGYANWDAAPQVPTTQWQAGRIYASVHSVPTDIALYTIRFGVWSPEIGSQLTTENMASEIVLP